MTDPLRQAEVTSMAASEPRCHSLVSELTGLVLQVVQILPSLSHLVDVVPHDSDSGVNLSLQRSGLVDAFHHRAGA